MSIFASQKSPIRKLILAIAAPVLLAFGSYVYTTVDTNRKDKLELVRGQIVQLYGPLYTLTTTNESIWNDLGKELVPNFDARREPDDNTIKKWHRLLKFVIVPLDDRIENTLLSSGEVIRCPNVSEALRNFFSFSESVKLIVSTWSSDDNVNGERVKDANMPKEHFPRNLTKLLKTELDSLHEQERKLDEGVFGPFLWLWLQQETCPESSEVASHEQSASLGG